MFELGQLVLEYNTYQNPGSIDHDILKTIFTYSDRILM